jgi:hypothetical protein
VDGGSPVLLLVSLTFAAAKTPSSAGSFTESLSTLQEVEMSDAQSKLQRLEDAGILDQKQFSAEEMALVATITDDEIDVLVRLRQKLGAPSADKNHIRPNFVV